jgi:hypothetical protein
VSTRQLIAGVLFLKGRHLSLNQGQATPAKGRSRLLPRHQLQSRPAPWPR